MNIPEIISGTRRLRDQLLSDPWRPWLHFTAPEGFFNDPNGLIFHEGRYHMFYLARSPIPKPDGTGETWVEVWDHVSSHDLLHWMQHPTALAPALDGSTPKGIWSGDAIEGAPQPTLIYHVPGQGTCIATSEDANLDQWTPLAENPVIAMHQEGDEFINFDTAAWYEGGEYHLLLGNKSNAPGHQQGDSTSYFTSPDLKTWAYQGPFYQSRREWTAAELDCACPDFFPFGDEHMLLMHGHKPVFHVHYYLGALAGGRFVPRTHQRMSGAGGCLCAPETWLDAQGRRIMVGWLREAGKWDDWHQRGWASAMSLPCVLEPDSAGGVRMTLAPELEALRGKESRVGATNLLSDEDYSPADLRGSVLDVEAEFDVGSAERVGLKVLCSPDGSEATVLEFDRAAGVLRAIYQGSAAVPPFGYEQLDPDGLGQHELPFELAEGEALRLRVIVDRSVVEVFANDRQALIVRVYPGHAQSDGVRFFASGGAATLTQARAWPLRRVIPW